MADTIQQFVRVCDCGCGEPTMIAGRNSGKRNTPRGEPRHFVRHHQRRSPVGAVERFWDRVDAADCWEYQGLRQPEGYGRFYPTAYHHTMAHRFAWENLVGPIPEGMTIDHLCQNPPCVNPDHLRLVSKGDNCLAGHSPPAMNRRKTHCIKGHPFSGGNLRVTPNGRRECVACRRERDARRPNRGRALLTFT